MNIDSNQKYYKLIFPRCSNNQRISLFEKIKLDKSKYNARDNGEFIPTIIFKERTAFIQESPLLPKQEYTVYEKVITDDYFRATNYYWVDPFFYDTSKQTAFYGNTCIYLVKKDGRFYDAVVGKEVPTHSFFTVHEINSKSDLEEMRDHFQLIKRHKKVYTDTITSIFKTYEREYLNYINAQVSYREELNKILESPSLTPEEVVGSIHQKKENVTKIKKINE